jgi:NADP-reducing hydrogenase subunit HndB
MTMPRLTSGDLAIGRQRARRRSSLGRPDCRARIAVHLGTCGTAAGGQEILAAFRDQVARQKITGVVIATTGCAGLCSREPMATVQLAGAAPVKYAHLTPQQARKIVAEHIVGGKVVSACVLGVGSEREA